VVAIRPTVHLEGNLTPRLDLKLQGYHFSGLLMSSSVAAKDWTLVCRGSREPEPGAFVAHRTIAIGVISLLPYGTGAHPDQSLRNTSLGPGAQGALRGTRVSMHR
jgi:hypothetical protein